MEKIDYSKPFPVRVIQDCRREYGKHGKLDGWYGVCLGLYLRYDITKKAKNVEEGNPLILTDCGDYIWGIECWWDPNPSEHLDVPLDLEKRVLEAHKEKLRKEFGMDD